MKVVILAGGLGTRLSEETKLIPKPMVEIGGKPILWHIMKIYSYYGFNDFIILTGYKSHVIKDYFVHYYQQYSDITVDMLNNTVEIHKIKTEPWKVTILYTGHATMTGGRIKKAQQYIGKESFLLTYGDGVADIDLNELIKYHKTSGKTVTMTAVQPSGRFGALVIKGNNLITSFAEKPSHAQRQRPGFFCFASKIKTEKSAAISGFFAMGTFRMITVFWDCRSDPADNQCSPRNNWKA